MMARAAVFLSMTFSWDDFAIFWLLTRFDTTLPVEIWNLMRSGLDPKTNAAVALVFGVSILLAIRFELVALRQRRAHHFHFRQCQAVAICFPASDGAAAPR